MTSQTRQERLWTENRSRLLALLPATNPQLSRWTGISRSAVERHMNRLHEEGRVHVSAYALPDSMNKGVLSKRYSVGIGIDAPRPPYSERQLRRQKQEHRKRVAVVPKFDPLAMMYARN